MKILIIAPLPAADSKLPLTGNSLPVKVLVDELKREHQVEIVDLSKKGYESGVNLGRIFQILRALWEVWKKRKGNDIIYLTVAESFAGNLRDIFIYLICYRKLSKTYIHMLGGAEMKNILNPDNGLQFKINRFFVSKLAGIIVEGQTQADTFATVASRNKIHVIPNFAEAYLFNNEENVIAKFNEEGRLRILFLSNMLYGKGHKELLEAYILLDPYVKSKVQLDFAGGFDSEEQKGAFLENMKDESNITYHGSVKGEVKKNLYHQAHIFCLPTYYPYEGQPFCIVEAYAGGCCVVTTNHSGIRNVFTDQVNGYEVEKKSVPALMEMIENCLNNRHELVRYGLNNLQSAKDKFTQKRYLESVKAVLKV